MNAQSARKFWYITLQYDNNGVILNFTTVTMIIPNKRLNLKKPESNWRIDING